MRPDEADKCGAGAMRGQKRKLTRFACAAAMAAAPAAAETAADGVVSARYLWAEDNGTGAAFGDFTLRAASGNWHAAVGMYGVVGRLHETYAHVGYDAAGLTVVGGFPRPAYDGFAVSPLDATMPRFALDRVGVTRSRTTYGTMFLSDYLPYGAAISGLVAGVRIAGSVHGVPDYDDAVIGMAALFGENLWALDIATERFETANGNGWNSKAQLRYDNGGTIFGAGLFAPAANDQPDAAEVFARTALTARLDATGLVRHTQGQDLLAVIGGHYAMSDASNAELGVALEGRNASVEIGVSFRF